MADRWLDVLDFSGYQVSDGGQVRSFLKRNGLSSEFIIGDVPRPLKPARHPAGHLHVVLCANGKRVTKKVHHLVLEAFVGPKPEGLECRHLNDVPSDNRLENLCWGTRAQNKKDAISNDRVPHGESHCHAKLTEEKVRTIFRLSASGLSQRAIAAEVGVKQQAVCKVLNGQRWKHLGLTKQQTS